MNTLSPFTMFVAEVVWPSAERWRVADVSHDTVTVLGDANGYSTIPEVASQIAALVVIPIPSSVSTSYSLLL